MQNSAEADASTSSCTAMSSLVLSLWRAVAASLRHLCTPNSAADAMHSASPTFGSAPLVVRRPTPAVDTTLVQLPCFGVTGRLCIPLDPEGPQMTSNWGATLQERLCLICACHLQLLAW